MSHLKPGSFSLHQSVALPEGATERFMEALVAERFTPPLPTQAESWGWVRFDAADSTGFAPAVEAGEAPRDDQPLFGSPAEPQVQDTGGPQDWMIAPWVMVAFRHDEKKVSGGALSMELAVKLREWCARNGQAKAPAQVREETRDTILKELLRRTPATPKTTPVWWDTSTGRLIIGSAQDRTVSAVRGAWARLICRLATGDVPHAGPAPEHYPTEIELVDELREPAPGAFWALTGDDAADDGRRTLIDAPAFLAWLWHQSETATTGLRTIRLEGGQELSWMVRDGVAVRDAETGKRRMSVRAEDAQSDPALRAAILDGHALCGLVLHVEVDGRHVHTYAMELDGNDVRISGIKLADPGGGSILERGVSAAYDLLGVRDHLVELLRAWGEICADPDRHGQATSTFSKWLGEELVEFVREKGLLRNLL